MSVANACLVSDLGSSFGDPLLLDAAYVSDISESSFDEDSSL